MPSKSTVFSTLISAVSSTLKIEGVGQFATKGTGVPYPRPVMLRTPGGDFLRHMPVTWPRPRSLDTIGHRIKHL
jgi:hypothetical protein